MGLDRGEAARLMGEEGAGRKMFALLAARFGVVVAGMTAKTFSMAK